MADSYSRWVMTDAFANNSQAAINAGQKIEWVSIKTSDDSHTFNDLSGFNATTLATATIRQTTNISSVTITGKTVTITGLFNSNNNTADYYIRTMFLVARYNGKEFLAGATVANSSSTAFRMPAASGTEITEFTARPQISVSNTSTISATVNPVASATNERVDGLEADMQGKINAINADKQNLWNKLAEYVTKAKSETIDGVKTFTKTIVGSITGNAGTATKLQTPRKINGTNFDGTADINVNAANDADIVHKSGNETISGNKIFTDYAKFTKLVNAPLSVRLVPSGTATIIDLINSVISEFGNGAFGTVRYMSMGQSFTDAPNANAYLMIDIVTRGPRTYVQILDADNNLFIGNVVNGATRWKQIAIDDTVMHLAGDETASGSKKFSGNISTTSDDSMINGGGNNGDIAFVKKSGTAGALVVGKNNSFAVKQSAGASVLPTDAQTTFFNVTTDGRVYAGTQQDLVPLDKNVVHKTGYETIAGEKRFTGTVTADAAINGMLATRTDAPFDLNMMNTYGATGVYGIALTNLANQPVARPGILHNIVLPSGSTYQTYIALETGVVYSRSYASSPQTWSPWKANADDGAVIHVGENAASATKLQTARLVGGVLFDGTKDIVLPGVNAKGTQDTSGRAANATNADYANSAARADIANKAFAFNTARKINGTLFDGTSDINVPASNDRDLVHRTGDESVGGNKTFNGVISFSSLIDGYTKTKFSPNTDLDLITQPGKYGILDNYTNQPNQPNTATTYKLLVVDKSVHDGVIYQTLYERRIGGATTDIYVRSTFNSVWNAWVKLPHNEEVVHNFGNEEIAGNKKFTDYATFTKLVNAPLSVRQVPSGTATIADLVKVVVDEFGDGAYGTVRYMSFNKLFNDSPFASPYLLIDISTRGARTYVEILDDNNNTAVTNVVNGELKTWRVLADDSKVVHIGDNASSATKLQTPRKINGTSFDGTSDINVKASNDANLVHKDANGKVAEALTFDGAINFTGQTGFITRQFSWTTGIMQGNWNIQRVGMWVMAKFDLTSTPTGTGNTTLALPVGFRPLSPFTRELEQGDAGISQNGTLYIKAIYRDQNAMTFVYPTNDAFPSA